MGHLVLPDGSCTTGAGVSSKQVRHPCKTVLTTQRSRALTSDVSGLCVPGPIFAQRIGSQALAPCVESAGELLKMLPRPVTMSPWWFSCVAWVYSHWVEVSPQWEVRAGILTSIGMKELPL